MRLPREVPPRLRARFFCTSSVLLLDALSPAGAVRLEGEGERQRLV